MSLIPEEIKEHYLQVNESDRLASGVGELERLRTEAILAAHLSPPPATIYDTSGAAGVYAFQLAERGYQVHLIDPVELHLEQARARVSASGVALASITLGDARRLTQFSYSDHSIISWTVRTVCRRFAKQSKRICGTSSNDNFQAESQQQFNISQSPRLFNRSSKS